MFAFPSAAPPVPWVTGPNRGYTNLAGRYRSPSVETREEFAGSDAQRVDYRLQSVHRDIHATAFEQAHVRTVKRAEVGERFLRDVPDGPEFADTGADPPLKFARVIWFHLNQSLQV